MSEIQPNGGETWTYESLGVIRHPETQELVNDIGNKVTLVFPRKDGLVQFNEEPMVVIVPEGQSAGGPATDIFPTTGWI